MRNKIYTNKKLLKALNSFRRESGLPEVVVKRRRCLKCDKAFTSLGKWNRLCDTCTRVNKHDDVIETYALGKK